MKVAVTANGSGLEARFVPVFGRSPGFVIVDTETMAAEAVANDAAGASGGAGIQAAQLVADSGAAAVITGNVGPNAFAVLASAGISVYTYSGDTVRDAVEAFKADRLPAAAAPTGPAHAGMGFGRGGGGGQGGRTGGGGGWRRGV